MTHIILFQDNPAADPQIRKTHMASHLAFLEQNADAIAAAGPLFDAAGAGQGGLWVMHPGSRADAERLIRADPFWPTGLRQSYAILKWRRVFAEGVAVTPPG